MLTILIRIPMRAYTRRMLLIATLILLSVAAKAVTANFSCSYIAGCSPLVVHFTNTSTAATSYYWDLGNSTTSTLTNPSGSYITPGTYTVTLTAYNGSSSSVRTQVITVYASPTISFIASDTSVCPGTPVTFTSTSIPGVVGPVTYYWNFGDGTYSTAASPTHVFTGSGYYNITLSITNSQGCTSTRTITSFIRVFEHSAVNFSTSSTHYCTIPATVTFTNTTTGSGPFSYFWQFGDGGTSTLASPTHTYTSFGTYTVRLRVTDVNGCVDTLVRSSYITVNDLTASFTSVTSACVNTPVTFYNTSEPHISSSWNFGDGGTATTDTGIHTYTSAGTYNVRLIVFNGFCYDTVVRSIVINPLPSGSFTGGPLHPCEPPVTITYTASTGSGTSVTWIYPSGSTSTGSTGSYTYVAPGVYSVDMVLVDGNGCTDTISRRDTVRDLIFSVSATPTFGCVPLPVAFDAAVMTSIPVGGVYPFGVTSYTWNFGDGSGTSTSAAPTHTYTAVGVYRAYCTITTANGCTARDTIDIYVGAPPVVTFTAAPMRVCYNRYVYFTSTVVTGPADYYVWAFGDGTGSSDSTGSTGHIFVLPGTFYVTVTPYYHGCPGPSYTLPDSIVVDSPMAQINLAYTCDPYTLVRFYNLSLGDDTHMWYFGDGGTSTLDSVSHNYSTPGIYPVTLTTYNATSGCRDTARVSVNTIPPVPRMIASDTAICPGDTVRFSPVITGGTAFNYYWYVNGALLNNDTGTNFNYIFETPGRYTIRLIIRDNHFCYDTATNTNWIIVGKPNDSFVVAPSSGCGPLSVTFVDHSSDISGLYISSIKWYWGDGDSALVSTATTYHTYTMAGVYDVTSVVTDNIGCKDTLLRPALIEVWRPIASFMTSNANPCVGAPVHFTNLSTGGVAFAWNFGDGDTSSVSDPDHTYTATGTYTVKLVVTDLHGCRDSAVAISYINVTRPNASFTMDDSFSICPPLTVNFTNTSSGGAVSYNWAFGDGGTSVLVSPTNLYTGIGLFTVRLIAINAFGCRDTATANVELYGYAGAFTYSPLRGCAPLTVFFDGTVSNVPSIVWDFADGTTTLPSTADTAVHIYTTPGAYVPKMILSDGTGCQASSLGLDTIKVNAIYAGFTTSPNPVCVNTSFIFQDTSHSFFANVVEWHWTFDGGDTSNMSDPSYMYTTTGVHTVTLTVKDDWGCINTITKTVMVYPPPVITASPDTTICVGDTGALYGYGGATYTWSPAASLTCVACNPTGALPATPTTYTVVGTDINGCQSSDTVRVSLRTHTYSRGWGDTEVCRLVPVQLYDTGGNKYQWIPSAGLSNANIWNPIATPDTTTNYMVIVQLGGCIPDTNFVKVIIHQLPTVTAGADQTLIAGSVAQLEATGTLIQRYLWTPGYTLDCDTCAKTLAHMLNTTVYTITVTSDFGCKAYDTVRINIFCNTSQIFIPNSFTPNGDGQNDVFYPRGSGVDKIIAFRIYNRWGELLFERTNFEVNDVTKAWDGSYNGNSPKPDVYVYMLEATCDTGEPLFLKGDVTIIR